MSRGIAYRRGLVRSLLAVVVSVGASSCAGEKIEQAGATVVTPANLATNKTGKADEPSSSVLDFQNRINSMESRFGWQGSLPGNRPKPGAARLPAPSTAPRRDSDKDDKKNKDWLSAPGDGALDYEASLGVTMFSTPKASATSSQNGASGQRPKPGATQPSDSSKAPGQADDPFNSPLQSYVRPDSIISPSFSGLGLGNTLGSGRSSRTLAPIGGAAAASPMDGLPTDLAPERTLDGILGRNVDRPQSSVPTVNSVLSGNTTPLIDPRRFETGVDVVLRQYRPAPTAVESITKPQVPSFSSVPKAPTLDDILSSSSADFSNLNNDRRSTRTIEPSRGFLDPKNRPPAILPGPKSSFGGF